MIYSFRAERFDARAAILLVFAIAGLACSSGPAAKEGPPPAPHETRLAAPLGDLEIPPLDFQTNADGTIQATITSEALFDRGSADLKSEALDVVQQLKDKLATAPYWVRVDGYTDGLGSSDSNQRLSQSRADALAGKIDDLGLAAGVQACGRGEAPGSGDAEDPQARRVVVTLSTTPLAKDCD